MSGVTTMCWVVVPGPKLLEAKRNANIRPPPKLEYRSQTRRIRRQQALGFGIVSSWDVSSTLPDPSPAAKERVNEVVLRQATLARDELMRERRARLIMGLTKLPEQAFGSSGVLARSIVKEAYKMCGEYFAEHDNLPYWVWYRRTDELLDGPTAATTTQEDMEAWEERLQDVFDGRPRDLYDVALVDTISKYPIDIQPFENVIKGMSMDLWKTRYMNFDELYLYAFYTFGAAGLMCLPIVGAAPESNASMVSIYRTVAELGIAAQLTDVLQHVGEDARRGRIYLPLDELERAGLSEEDVFRGIVTDKWRSFMKEQIKRMRKYYAQVETGLVALNAVCRWPVTASLLIHNHILDAIEANDYDNFTKRADVGIERKLLSLVVSYRKSYHWTSAIR